MPAKKIVKTKKAPAYQPDEEYLHNYITAEVAVQLEGKRKEIKLDVDNAVMLRFWWKEKDAKCHPLTCESKRGHYFASWDMAIACALAFVVWLFSSYTIEYIITTILWSL